MNKTFVLLVLEQYKIYTLVYYLQFRILTNYDRIIHKFRDSFESKELFLAPKEK